MPSIRKNKNTWIILAVVIFLAAALYYFFYRNNSISAFQAQQFCLYSALTDIIKYKSGKFPEITSLPASCANLSEGDFYSVIPSQTSLYNTYHNLLSESTIVKKFLNTERNNGNYVLAKEPSNDQSAFSEEVGKYLTAIVDGISAVKGKLTSSDTALTATVNGILAKYGPESQTIKDHGSIAEYIKTLPITYANKTPEQVVMSILSNFKAFEIAPGCDDQMTVLDITGNYDNILDFTYVLKLLYGIVKAKYSTAATPGLTFAMLKAAPNAYTVIKAYYLNPMNAFTGYIYDKQKYATEDLYMTAIISNINNDIYTNIANDGKIKKSTLAAQDILYTRLKLFTDKCSSISGKSACYTADVKTMCEKIKYIIDYTGSIEDIDVVGYSLPTVPGGTTTTADGGTTTTADGGTTTTADGAITTTAAGATSTTAAGATSTTAAGATSTTAAGATSTTAAGATSTTAAGATSTTAAGATSTTGPMIFDLASQLDYQKFLDDLSVLFTGRTGDPSEVVNTLLNLNQEQRNSICSTYCNGLYTECTDICRLAKCENCTGGVDNTITGVGKPSTDTGYSNYNASYNLLDNISDNQLGLGGGQGGTSSHVGPMLYQKDGDGISNIFAPYVLVQPAATSSGAGYSSFMLNNPNDPLYKAYLSQLITDYNNAQ